LEKIKTVGDCYLCAGGLPFPSQDHAHSILLAALDIAQFVKESKENQKEDEIRFEIRIGVNTGPVVAGVVGSRKFAYDIWGNTVNIASRMETNSEAGRINISENTYQLVKFNFDCEYRGEIEVKSKGNTKMYFVNGIKDLSIKHDTGGFVLPEVRV
jgi:class 3 adenylate cyclase